MKKNRFLCATISLILLVAIQINAQKFSVGASIGGNFQNITGTNQNGDKLKNSLVLRFAVGVNGSMVLAPDYSAQVGLLYATKGASADISNAKVNLSYLEIPINLFYKPKLGNGKLILGFGPYIGIGLGGSVKGNTNGSSYEQSVSYKKTITTTENNSTSTAYFAPLDFGGNFIAGYEFDNGFSVQLNTQLGLTDINATISGITGDKTSVNNTGFGLSVGYKIK